jgi:tetratricopeptide (TPR) repeat protein
MAQLDWGRRAQAEEATRFFTAAVASRPRSSPAHDYLGLSLHDQGKLDEAVAELRTAVRLKPDSPGTHQNLGRDLALQGQLDEAITAFRTAVRLKPDFPEAYINLGNTLRRQGKSDDAITAYLTALRFRPDFFRAYNNIGSTLANQGKFDEAIAAFRKSIGLRPDDPVAHLNLALALRQRGEFTAAIAELRVARDLANGNLPFVQNVEHEITITERQVALGARLPAVLAGKVKPADAAESLDFAQFCYEKTLHGSSARLWAETFQAQPKLAEDMQAQHRFNAACAAALAGCGQTKDDPPLDDAARARWRKQAIDWLKADLAAWTKILEGGTPQARQAVSKALQHWKADPDLAGLRDPSALGKHPEYEQKACRALWADVDALLAKARAATKP